MDALLFLEVSLFLEEELIKNRFLNKITTKTFGVLLNHFLNKTIAIVFGYNTKVLHKKYCVTSNDFFINFCFYLYKVLWVFVLLLLFSFSPSHSFSFIVCLCLIG